MVHLYFDLNASQHHQLKRLYLEPNTAFYVFGCFKNIETVFELQSPNVSIIDFLGAYIAVPIHLLKPDCAKIEFLVSGHSTFGIPNQFKKVTCISRSNSSISLRKKDWLFGSELIECFATAQIGQRINPGEKTSHTRLPTHLLHTGSAEEAVSQHDEKSEVIVQLCLFDEPISG
ncbi:MAG: hypothetical protein SF029_20645 [bacterium]|nr:hypothetical protein [bacterium]